MGGTERGSLNWLVRSRGSVSCQEKVRVSSSLRVDDPLASQRHCRRGFLCPALLSATRLHPQRVHDPIDTFSRSASALGQGRCTLIGPPESHARLRTNDWSVWKGTRLLINQSRRPLEQGAGVLFPQSVGCVQVGHTSVKEILEA